MLFQAKLYFGHPQGHEDSPGSTIVFVICLHQMYAWTFVTRTHFAAPEACGSVA